MDMDGSKDTSKAYAKLNKILKLVHIRNVSSHIANTDKNPGIQNFIA